MPDITAANAILILSASDAQGNVLLTSQQIQGFATDDIYTMARTTPVETRMGVDGTLSGGFIFTEKKVEYTLAASSLSNSFFDALNDAMEGQIMAYELTGSLSLPSLGIYFTKTTGFLTGYSRLPDAKKVLEFRRYEITWQGISGAPITSAG
jgi:hypothetical protein